MNRTTPSARTSRAVAALCAVAALAVAGSATAEAQPAPSTGPSPSVSGDQPGVTTCPALYVFGVQDGGEGAATTVNTGDSGMLGRAFGSMISTAEGLIERSYIVFGSEVDSSDYPVAVSAAAAQLEQHAAAVIQRCPLTQVAVAGYAQGAAAAATFADSVGAGRSMVSSDKVAGVALIANPARRAATGALPGTATDTSVPSAAVGTAGTHLATINLTNTGLSGAGIDAAAGPVSYGTLTGRVADLCVAGDATCDVVSGSPLLAAVANIGARAEGKDPVAAIGAVAEALAATVFGTAVGVVNDDLTGTSLDQLSYAPSKTLGQRIAEASSPTATAVTETDALSALFSLGTIGLNAVITVAQKVFTATTIAELAAVGLSNPVGALAVLGTKVADAVVELVPPQSAIGWVNDAFEAISTTVTDTQDLYTTSATAQYSDDLGRRSSYTTTTSSGESPLTATAHWFVALARDLATANPPTSASPTTMTAPATASSTTTNPTTTQPNSSTETATPTPAVSAVPRP